jgi:CheY-like chemotaxis protein
VLVVDDEDYVRRLARQMLKRIGYDVLLAQDGREGLEIYRTHADEISAVILDLTMPGLDGGETLRELRRIRTDVPVLLTSGYSEVEVSEHVSGQPFEGFLPKPFQLEELRRALHTVLAPEATDGV